MADIENPCVVATELPLEECVHRARQVEQSAWGTAVQPQATQSGEGRNVQ